MKSSREVKPLSLLTLVLASAICLLALGRVAVAGDLTKVDKREIQSAFELAFEHHSIDGLSGPNLSFIGQENWAMLLGAKDALELKWLPVGEQDHYEIEIEAPVMVGFDSNSLAYPYRVKFKALRFRTPRCLDLNIEAKGRFLIYRSDDGSIQKRSIELEEFTPHTSNLGQCV
ncbi:MAG: hypothetical protein JST16_03815 [Bdellovibrionales bacterium]|nr:hypothetical protein [Bdellovibrionales bacterium]